MDPDVAKDFPDSQSVNEALRALSERRSATATELEAAEQAWLEASEQLEKLQAGG